MGYIIKTRALRLLIKPCISAYIYRFVTKRIADLLTPMSTNTTAIIYKNKIYIYRSVDLFKLKKKNDKIIIISLLLRLLSFGMYGTFSLSSYLYASTYYTYIFFQFIKILFVIFSTLKFMGCLLNILL